MTFIPPEYDSRGNIFPTFLKRGRDGLYRAANGLVFSYTPYPPGDIPIQLHQYDPKFIREKEHIIELRYTDDIDGSWQDSGGTIFALDEGLASLDPIVRCGVGWFSFPESSPLTDACRPHDFKYSSKVYQYFHNRSEADADLERDVETVAKGTWREVFGPIFWDIVRPGGRWFWENKNTRDK